jgi:hypothetical protein
LCLAVSFFLSVNLSLSLYHCSLNWQHQLCKNPRPNPDIKTLFTDHTCSPSNGPLAPTPANLPISAVAKPVAYTSLGVHGVRYLAFQLIGYLSFQLINNLIATMLIMIN